MNENLIIVMIVSFAVAAIGNHFYKKMNKKNGGSCTSCSCGDKSTKCK